MTIASEISARFVAARTGGEAGIAAGLRTQRLFVEHMYQYYKTFDGPGTARPNMHDGGCER